MRRCTDPGGGVEHFKGMILEVCGDDEALNSILEDIDFISGVKILSRCDLDEGRGVLIIQAMQYAKQAIIKLAKKYELVVS
jgi:hypothetical protein